MTATQGKLELERMMQWLVEGAPDGAGVPVALVGSATAEGELAMTIAFPSAPEARYEEDSPMQDADFADLSGLRVVVVEDDADARDLLVDVLEAQGAEVRGAGNGADAIDAVASWRPHVLVSDIGLPDMDRYALIRRVRALGASAGGDVPAIALTGYADLEDSRRALAAGYQVHVAKPIDSSLLTHAVANVAGAGTDDA